MTKCHIAVKDVKNKNYIYCIMCGYMQNTRTQKNSSLHTDWMMASLNKKIKPIVFLLNAYWLIIHIVCAISI